MLQLCRLWQVQEGVHLDGVLVCGDLGYFPDMTHLDKATKWHAKRDPEELGFAEFFTRRSALREDPWLRSVFAGDPDDLRSVRCPVVFCHGNHEDFRALAEIGKEGPLVAVDVFRRIYYLRSGEVTELAGLRIGALGGEAELPGQPDGPLFGPRVSRKAAQRLMDQFFDVLLSHAGPWEVVPQGKPDIGSRAVSEVIRACHPAYNFYGHYGFAVAPVTLGQTRCIWHEGVAFQRISGGVMGPIQPGCMGVLCWGARDEHSYSLVDGAWFRGVTAHTWPHLL